jgi:menaquinone-dependent protoporphyrinogen oxidase
MPGRILVAYATRAGATAEVAEAVAEVLRTGGNDVTVSEVRQVRDVGGYDGIVLGSAVRMGKVMPEALRFARRNHARLASIPTACFSVGITMHEDTAERRELAERAIKPLTDLLRPRKVGLFGGKVDPARLEFPWRLFLKQVKEGEMAPGDHRDFDKIRAWAEDTNSIF